MFSRVPRRLSSLLVLSLLLAPACLPLGMRSGEGSSSTAVFERVWADFDAYYGLFDAKGVDWNEVRSRYAPRVLENASDTELHAVLCEMLLELDDAHVTLYPATSPELPSCSVDLVDGAFPEPPFDPEIVRAHYLATWRRVHRFVLVGRLESGLAYLHLSSFDGNVDELDGALDAALAYVADAPGLVIDVRDNPGGFDPLAQRVAGRFADASRVYMRVRKRNGPSHEDFSDEVVWTVAPSGRRRFTGPIALLTTYATQSAGETFTLAMKTLPHVVQVGDTTAGAFSDNVLREAGNGWAYSISVGDYRAADGTSYEGIGLAPDVPVLNDRDELAAGRDRVLETAIALLAGS